METTKIHAFHQGKKGKVTNHYPQHINGCGAGKREKHRNLAWEEEKEDMPGVQKRGLIAITEQEGKNMHSTRTEDTGAKTRFLDREGNPLRPGGKKKFENAEVKKRGRKTNFERQRIQVLNNQKRKGAR